MERTEYQIPWNFESCIDFWGREFDLKVSWVLLIFSKVMMAAVYLCSSCRMCSSSPLTFSSSSVLLCKNEFISAKINALALTFTRNKRETIITLNNFTSDFVTLTKQLLRSTNVLGSPALLICTMPRDWFAWKIQPEEGKDLVYR